MNKNLPVSIISGSPVAPFPSYLSYILRAVNVQTAETLFMSTCL